VTIDLQQVGSDPFAFLLVLVVVVIWLVLGVGCATLGTQIIRYRGKLLDDITADVAVGIFTSAFGILILVAPIYAIRHPDNRPCVRYETTYQYNAATKTTMPVRYCAQYGEWVEP
jgi:hypothetical protein